jgi:hypothetical protein
MVSRRCDFDDECNLRVLKHYSSDDYDDYDGDHNSSDATVVEAVAVVVVDNIIVARETDVCVP